MPPAATSQQALGNLQQFQGSMKNPADVLKQSQDTSGATQAQTQLTGLQGAISNTTNLLNQVAPSVMGRTQNSLVTQAQATRQIGNEQAPIQQNLTSLGQQEGQAATQYQNAEQRALAEANAIEQGQTQQLGGLQSIYQALTGQEQSARDEAYRQQQAAESKRQFDAQMADTQAARAAAATATARSSGGGSTSSSGRAAPQATYTRDPGGGFQFKQGGQPITAAQYISSRGGGWQDLATLFSESKNLGDVQLAQAMRAAGGVTQAMVNQYPYIFGGV